jgi:hypothetical protein
MLPIVRGKASKVENKKQRRRRMESNGGIREGNCMAGRRKEYNGN